MDNEKINELIAENMKTVFGFALSRLGNVQRAEELASDILYNMLKSAHTLRDEQKFHAFQWRVAENTYIDYLRRSGRIRRSQSEEYDENAHSDGESVEDIVVHKEEMNLLRRELSLLTSQYRRATVLYYMEDNSCGEIAEKLKVSVEMVKYYLFRARNIIREGMKMDRMFGEKSYNPRKFAIDFWGTHGSVDEEYRWFWKYKLPGNILHAAYYTSVTMQELSIELGVAVPYLEDMVNVLIEKRYLVEKNGKYRTNIPIITEDCRKAILEKTGQLIAEAAEKLINGVAVSAFAEKFGGKFPDENSLRWQAYMIMCHLALNDEDSVDDELPNDGVYAHHLGGKGIIWGMEGEEPSENRIRGIYDDVSATDGRSDMIAYNFAQVLNVQKFQTGGLQDMISCVGVDCYQYLPEDCREQMDRLGYAVDGKPNFPVYTDAQFEEAKESLSEAAEIVAELCAAVRNTGASVNADLAPEHIRREGELVGRLKYTLTAIESLCGELYTRGWLREPETSFKPAMAAIRHV